MTRDRAQPDGCGALARRVNEIYHDQQAGEFDAIHRFRHRVERTFWESEVVPCLRNADLRFGLDLCTGTGFVPRALLGHLNPSCRILCVDLSEEALRRALSLLGELADRVTTRPADVQALPLEDESVDWITLNAGLHHIPRPEDTLREIGRVLRPGGYFCLGYEPNAAFFASRRLVLLEKMIWHLFWYVSPTQNRRRIQKWLGRPARTYEDAEHLTQVNTTLLAEGAIQEPLDLDDLRHLVDPHAQSSQDHTSGFHPDELIERCFPGYSVETLMFSDYGGDMLRKHLLLRSGLDRVLGALCPGKGRLFSWIVRKPPSEAKARRERC